MPMGTKVLFFYVCPSKRLRIWPQALARLSTQLCPLNPANGMEEALMDFTCEAQAVLKEVSYAIAEGILSQKLESSNTCAHINLTTKEGKEMTVRLSGRGFEVTSYTAENSDIACRDAFKMPVMGVAAAILRGSRRKRSRRKQVGELYFPARKTRTESDRHDPHQLKRPQLHCSAPFTAL